MNKEQETLASLNPCRTVPLVVLFCPLGTMKAQALRLSISLIKDQVL